MLDYDIMSQYNHVFTGIKIKKQNIHMKIFMWQNAPSRSGEDDTTSFSFNGIVFVDDMISRHHQGDKNQYYTG